MQLSDSNCPVPAHLAYRTARALGPSSRKLKEPITSIILEGEMVCYNESTEQIDEFGYVHECSVNERQSGAPGPLQAKPKFDNCSRNPNVKWDNDLLESSQTTTTTSSGGTGSQGMEEPSVTERHVKVVWFDVLMLNGRSLIFG